MTNRELAAVLARWGEIGGRPMPPAPWGPAAKMIAAAERDAERAGVALDELLKTSAAELPRVGDPLLVDFDTHRWLREEHELAYSDWLAWVLEQRSESGAVLSLFGREPGALAGTPCKVHREIRVPEGQLDIVIRCDGTAALAVEVKTTSEPDADQLGRYLEWLGREKHPLGLVLLATRKPESLVSSEWSFRCWGDVTSGLRTWAAEWCEQGRLMQAAMTLAFCGAVEQNLLGYCREGINTPETARYIESWLERRNNDKDKARH